MLRLYNISNDESHLSKVQEFQRQRNHVQAAACVENNSDPEKFGNFASEMVLVALANDDYVQANRIWQSMTSTGQIQTDITDKSLKISKILMQHTKFRHLLNFGRFYRFTLG